MSQSLPLASHCPVLIVMKQACLGGGHRSEGSSGSERRKGGGGNKAGLLSRAQGLLGTPPNLLWIGGFMPTRALGTQLAVVLSEERALGHNLCHL